MRARRILELPRAGSGGWKEAPALRSVKKARAVNGRASADDSVGSNRRIRSISPQRARGGRASNRVDGRSSGRTGSAVPLLIFIVILIFTIRPERLIAPVIEAAK